MALHLIGLAVTLWSVPCQATPILLNMSLEGSAEGEEVGSDFPDVSTTATSGLASPSSTTLGGSTHVELSLLDQMVQFLQENMLLILVASVLFITVFLILCCACIMSRKRKLNAYYPSSFPSKMYVDLRDKSGDAKLFNEVPVKLSNMQQAKSTDPSRQLQEDIMRATKNLRTPSKPSQVRQQEKAPASITAAQTPEVNVPAEGEHIENVSEPSSTAEQREGDKCPLSDNEAQQISCPEQPEVLPEETGLIRDNESLTGAETCVPGHLEAEQEGDRHDSIVTESIPLITGEKTAF